MERKCLERFGVVLMMLTLVCCSAGPPALESRPGHIPVVADLQRHVECELRPLVAAVGKNKHLKLIQVEPEERILETDDEDLRSLYQQDPKQLDKLLHNLVEYTFVSSISMTLDVLDTQQFSPSLNFIDPLDPKGATSLAVAVGASLGGTQEHYETFNTTINMTKLWEDAVAGKEPGGGCFKEEAGGIEGKLGLVGDVINGLQSIDAAAEYNFASSASPLVSSASAPITGFPTLEFSTEKKSRDRTVVRLNGAITVSAPATGEAGSLTVVGIINVGGYDFFANLTGTTIQNDQNIKNGILNVPYSITGTLGLTDSHGGKVDGKFGYGPKLTLIGSVNVTGDNLQLSVDSGTLVPDTTANGDPQTTDAYFYSGTESIKVFQRNAKMEGANLMTSFSSVASSGSTTGGAAKASGGGTGATSNTTQFTAFENFQLSYGVNGGPNWTLTHFKGPAGGSNSLLTLNRNDSDSLTMTFVAACRQDGVSNILAKDYWSAIPICDQSGILTTLAAQSGQYTNNFHTR